MSNFDDLDFSAQKPHGTVRATLIGFYARGAEPIVLIMRHAGESNHAFMNKRRKIDNVLKSYGDEIPLGVLRRHLIPVFAETVIEGWENVLAADRKTPVPYSPGAGEELLTKIAKDNPDVIDRAFAYAMPAAHFRDSVGSVEALGNG